jgi:hypothetical protein
MGLSSTHSELLPLWYVSSTSYQPSREPTQLPHPRYAASSDRSFSRFMMHLPSAAVVRPTGQSEPGPLIIGRTGDGTNQHLACMPRHRPMSWRFLRRPLLRRKVHCFGGAEKASSQCEKRRMGIQKTFRWLWESHQRPYQGHCSSAYCV